MASGCYNYYQHTLLDLPELTLDAFLDLCDEWYYGSYRLGTSVEQAKNRCRERLEECQEDYNKAVAELNRYIYEVTNDDLKQEYEEYVRKTKERNAKWKEDYEREVERLKQIRQWAKGIPQLEWIWKTLVEPNLYQDTIQSFEAWKKSRYEELERRVRFYMELVLEAKKNMLEAEREYEKYERAKKALRESE